MGVVCAGTRLSSEHRQCEASRASEVRGCSSGWRGMRVCASHACTEVSKRETAGGRRVCVRWPYAAGPHTRVEVFL